jgi:hypothetical protein
MKVLDPKTRYREYLGTFGITEDRGQVAELHDLDLESVWFFAYSGSGGLRFKVAITQRGLVTAGGHADDDWYGFLSGMPDAEAAAARIAWLETDESISALHLPSRPVMPLVPDHLPAAGIDPEEWAFVEAPTLHRTPDGCVILVAWFLPNGFNVPQRWTVTAQPDRPAIIVCTLASELLVSSAGSSEAVAAEASNRARRLLASGTEDERRWALLKIGETGDRSAVGAVAELLENGSVSADVRVLAAGTFPRIGDPAAVVPLGAALLADFSPEVRRACAQALGRIGGPSAVAVLGNAGSCEPDTIVRTEIINALTAQGGLARNALSQIAGSDADIDLRELARQSLEAIE